MSGGVPFVTKGIWSTSSAGRLLVEGCLAGVAGQKRLQWPRRPRCCRQTIVSIVECQLKPFKASNVTETVIMTH